MLADSRQRIIYKEKLPTMSGDTVDPLIEQINDCVGGRAAGQLKRGTELAGLGICIAAFVDSETGELYGGRPILKSRKRYR